jgi:hypothetical protein
MEIIKLPKTKNTCYYCKRIGYFTYSGGGGDYFFCPICNSLIHEFCSGLENENGILCCNKCKIPFMFGCIHGENGCTDGIHHTLFIKKFTLNNITYDGIPKFETYDDVCLNIDKLDCEWYCTCNDNQYDCPNAFYKRDIEKCEYKN